MYFHFFFGCLIRNAVLHSIIVFSLCWKPLYTSFSISALKAVRAIQFCQNWKYTLPNMHVISPKQKCMAVFYDPTSCHMVTSRFFQTLNLGGKMFWPKSMDRFCRLQLMATFEEPTRAIIEFSTMSRVWPADWSGGWKLPSTLWRSCQIDSKWPTWYLHKVMLWHKH